MMANPLGCPSIKIDMDTETDFNHWNMLTVTEHRELNVPQDPCEEDPGYSFRSCIKETFSNQVGCRTYWDTWSHQQRRVCNDFDSYR